MFEKKKDISLSGSLGTGYVSIIMVFVVICLTVLAALSFTAAYSSEGVSLRNRESTQLYYNAENRANNTLMQIDEAAFNAYDSGLFSMFAESAAAISGVSVSPCPDGYKVSWSESITERLSLVCEAVVYSEPQFHDGHRYDITRWDTVASGSSAETPISVWDGSMF